MFDNINAFKTPAKNEVTSASGTVHVDSLRVDILIAGFSCKDASNLNVRRSAMGNCLKTGAGSTGETWTGTVAAIKLLEPRMILLENVKGLCQRSWDNKSKKYRPAQIDTVVDELTRLGYAVEHGLRSPDEFGIPQRRTRVWIAAAKLQPHASPPDFIASVASLVQSAKRPLKDLLPLSTFLLDHIPPPKAPTAPQMQNIEAARAKLTADDPDNTDWTCICTNSAKRSDAHPEVGKGRVPCLRPAARVWVESRKRLLAGIEGLNFQGVSAEEFPTLRTQDLEAIAKNDSLHADLAGNAFSGHVAVVMATALMASVGKLRARQWRSPAKAGFYQFRKGVEI